VHGGTAPPPAGAQGRLASPHVHVVREPRDKAQGLPTIGPFGHGPADRVALVDIFGPEGHNEPALLIRR